MAAIPPALESELIERAAQGASTRDLSQWLKDAKGITASYKAVQRLLSRTKSERADVAKAIVRETITKELPKDLERLEGALTRAVTLAERLHKRTHEALDALADPEDADPSALRVALASFETLSDRAIKASNAELNAFKVRLHFAGADTPDSDADAASLAEQSFNSRMAGLATRLRKAGVVPEPDKGGA